MTGAPKDQGPAWLRKLKAHPLVAILATIVVVASGLSTILGLPETARKAWDAVTNAPKPVVTFANADLETETNVRYGFSFQYPVGWVRKDPMNSDGYTFVDPDNPLVVVRAYGSLMVLSDTLEEEVQQREQYIENDGGRVLQSTYSGGETYHVAGGGRLSREDAEGWFLRYRKPAEPREPGSPDVTVVSRVVFVQGHHFVTIEAQAPSKMFHSYDRSFQRLTALLRVYDKCNGSYREGC